MSRLHPETISRVVRASFAAAVLTLAVAGAAHAGSIFLTGHDPDFHASLGGNSAGAIKINQVAIGYVTDPMFNPYAVVAHKFLFVESSIAPPSGHTVGKNGIIASGYVDGVDFEHHDAATLNAELNLLGTKYCAIVVASDFGGVLTQAELGILNARRADIITFVNGGGGLYAMAESNSGAGLTPQGGWFTFVPKVVSSVSLNQSESGFTVSPFGALLGLSAADINGNASHNVFNAGTVGLDPVDYDANGNIMSLAGRSDAFVATPPATWGAVKALFRR